MIGGPSLIGGPWSVLLATGHVTLMCRTKVLTSADLYEKGNITQVAFQPAFSNTAKSWNSKLGKGFLQNCGGD